MRGKRHKSAMGLVVFSPVLYSLTGLSTASAQSSPGVIDRTVAAGKSTVLLRLRTYESDRGCVPAAAATIDTSPKPRLGQITSKFEYILSDGPCGKMEYPHTTVIYQAGNEAGVEEINVYFYFTRGRDEKTVRVTVAGGASASSKSINASKIKPTSKSETTIRSATPEKSETAPQEKAGKREGRGIHTYSDGAKYAGAWKDGKPHGKGTYTFPDGRKYEGAWGGGKYNGQGTFTFSDGAKYVGAWKDGKRE